MMRVLHWGLRRLSMASVLKLSSPSSFYVRPALHGPEPFWVSFRPSMELTPRTSWGVSRRFSHGTVNLVISPEGQPKFETREMEPPKKEKWLTKKRLKLRRKSEKQKRKSANKRDPRRLGPKGKKRKQRFANAEERIKYKLERARVKEALLVERLKRYEVPQVQGPMVKPHELTGEERFYMKKMAQKRSNYVPVGRRGVFGGVILNMHLHWKKHETVKVICKPCKPGQINEYANEIARLSGGIPIQVIGDDTIVFYRGKNYEQPEVMSPIDTLSKKRALEKSKYEQSLESVRRFIAIAEKELELYYRHVALYGDPNDRNPNSIIDNPRKVKGPRKVEVVKEETSATVDICAQSTLIEQLDSMDHYTTESEELSEIDGNYSNEDQSESELNHDEDGILTSGSGSRDEEINSYTSTRNLDVSFGIIGLGVGITLLSYGFGAYFNILPGSEWSAIMLTYGFPLAIIGMAFKYAELKPVPCLTYSDAQKLREKCATSILKQVRNDVTRYRYGDEQHLDEALKRIFQYGQGGGIPRRSAPILQMIREEVTDDGKYCLVLVFEAKALQSSDFEQRQAKFASFFGPGITAEVVKGEKDLYEVRLISSTTL